MRIRFYWGMTTRYWVVSSQRFERISPFLQRSRVLSTQQTVLSHVRRPLCGLFRSVLLTTRRPVPSKLWYLPHQNTFFITKKAKIWIFTVVKTWNLIHILNSGLYGNILFKDFAEGIRAIFCCVGPVHAWAGRRKYGKLSRQPPSFAIDSRQKGTLGLKCSSIKGLT